MLFKEGKLAKPLANITMEDLVNDAVERKDLPSLKWLEEQCLKLEYVRKDKKTGKDFTVPVPITTVRVDYLKTYCGWTPKGDSYNKESARKKKEALFAKAFEALSDN